tara:strand:+ start:622 stop:1839 length:1218 start_codon:yes stop_codon:yes gene_type:complete
MKIKNCRICKSKKLLNIFDLGNQALTGKFPENKKIKIPKSPLKILLCNSCKAIQLDRNFNPKNLFNTNYGYRSGINQTMSDHLRKLSILIKKNFLKKNKNILDIASNDGTFLNFFSDKYFRVGIDPVLKKYSSNYKKKIVKIPNLFSKKILESKVKNKKFNVITIFAMFYDLNDPYKFLLEVKKILDNQGVLIIEVADLYETIKNNVFDTICHEHLIYYSHSLMKLIMDKSGFKIFDHSYNDINGGTSRYFITHKENMEIKNKNLAKVKKNEINIGLHKIETYVNFFKKISKIKLQTIKLLKSLKSKKKIIHGYGASTKGNVLMQYFKINNKIIECIADRNPDKNGHYTPGTNIKIISEELSRSNKPDYYFVLPWHFKKEILIREKKMIKKGTKFIFPLPKLEIV